jgi:Arc/MetJ-type ribon-helix-helix transcriptional regulator
MKIEISQNLAHMIEEQVKAGRFPTATAAVNAAVDFMFFEHHKNPGAIRASIDEGLADLDAGRFSDFTAEEATAECQKQSAAKRGR